MWPLLLATVAGLYFQSVLAFIAVLVIRFVQWFKSRFRQWRAKRGQGVPYPPPFLPVRCLVVLGSGGHTMEILQLVKDWDPDRYYIDFVVADTDKTSEPKLRRVLADCPAGPDKFNVSVIPRAREVGQSWLTSIFTTLKAILSCFVMVFKMNPHLVLVNGPGTCVPVVMVALLYELLLGRRFSLVFVESFCRTRNLSMYIFSSHICNFGASSFLFTSFLSCRSCRTGRILYPWADRVVVHHEQLSVHFPKCEYLGCIY